MEDSRIDELYAAPLDRFIPERTALVKELKAAGDREGAARVQSLRKPSVSAWAVNQLTRDRRTEIEELLGLGEDLRSAQRKALTGGGAKELQRLAGRRRELVDRLTDRAGRILRNAGSSGSRVHLDEVANTLLATATDPNAAADVRRARLERDLPPPAGFGEFDFAQLADVIPMTPRRKVQAKETKGQPERVAKVESAAAARARKRAEELAKEAEEAAAEARERRQEADLAESEARRVTEEAERAERAAARAGREADRAEQRAAAAQGRAGKAAARLSR